MSGSHALLLTALGALLAGSACTGSASAGPTTIEITIHHSRFEPGHLEVERGSEITFVIHNEDPIAHEFILGDEEVQDVHEAGTGHHHGKVPGEISVPAGRTRRTTYVFETAGTVLIGCHVPNHYDYGMKGTVEVLD